jgi:hypothetical protein
MANPLAYYATETIASAKSFSEQEADIKSFFSVALTPGVNLMKTFFAIDSGLTCPWEVFWVSLIFASMA